MYIKSKKTYVIRVIISVSAFVMLLSIAISVYASSCHTLPVLPDEYIPQNFKRSSNIKDYIFQSVDPDGKEDSGSLRYNIYGPHICIPIEKDATNFVSANPKDPNYILGGRDLVFTEIQVGQWSGYYSLIYPYDEYANLMAVFKIGPAVLWFHL